MSSPRVISVLSTGRQDWGILRSLCGLLDRDPEFDLTLLLGGMHCSSQFGMTEKFVRDEGFRCEELLPWIPEDSVPAAYAQAGGALSMVGEALHRLRPEAIILAGDRVETAAAAIAATATAVPIVHLHGGEESEGAFDNALRHAITKMSHLHFVSHPDHARRVIAMGEDPAAVHVVGAPGLDNLHRTDLADRSELEDFLSLELLHPVVLVTLHPATWAENPESEASSICRAMDEINATYVITLPNSDPGSEAIRETLIAVGKRARRVAVDALGERRYWGLMRIADAMLGNSSSALIEAPSIGLPAVNVGFRQSGRLRGANVIDVPAQESAIADALKTALSPEFRREAQSAPPPFGDGRSGARMLEILRRWKPPSPPRKKWVYQ